MPKRSEREKRNQRRIERKKAFIKSVNKFLNNNFKWFIVLSAIFILVSGYFFLLKPKQDNVQKVVNIINQRREKDYQNKKRQLEKIRDLLLAYSKINSAYIEKIDSIAPPDIDGLFTEMNQLISRQGLFVQSLNINEVGSRDPKISKSKGKNIDYLTSGKIGRIKIGISVRGTDYESFKNLLYSLENNLRLIDVERVNFNPSSQSTELTLYTYYIKDRS